jgi:hypothetical protein
MDISMKNHEKVKFYTEYKEMMSRATNNFMYSSDMLLLQLKKNICILRCHTIPDSQSTWHEE